MCTSATMHARFPQCAFSFCPVSVYACPCARCIPRGGLQSGRAAARIHRSSMHAGPAWEILGIYQSDLQVPVHHVPALDTCAKTSLSACPPFPGAHRFGVPLLYLRGGGRFGTPSCGVTFAHTRGSLQIFGHLRYRGAMGVEMFDW